MLEGAGVSGVGEALYGRKDAEDALWVELKKYFADDQLIELTMLAGLYRAVSYICKVTRVESEAFAPKFPV